MRALVVIIVLVIAGLIVIPQTFFTVDETQLAIVTRFGAYQRTHDQPGLYVKTPFVEAVTRFDSRLLRVDAPPASLLTRDKKNLVIDAYARYKIVDPLQFFRSLRSELQAEARVGDIVASRLRREVALDLQDEVITATRELVMARVTEASNRDEIEVSGLLELPGGIDNPEVTIEVTEIRGPEEDPARGRPPTLEEIAALRRDPTTLEGFEVRYFLPVRSTLGIDIIDVRIKRADFPPDVATSVFARMEAERQRIASGLRAEGAEEDAKIRADVDRRVNVILESAQGEAALLRGEAEQEAINILAEALEKDPEFYDFRRSLEAYINSFDGQTTIVLDPESDLLKYLQDPSGEEEQ